MIDLTNWIRKNTGATDTYYGYANPGISVDDNKWLIRKETIESGDTVYQYANDKFSFDSIWREKEEYFMPPVSAITINNSSITNNMILFDFDMIPGVSDYSVTVTKSGHLVMPWNKLRVKPINVLVSNKIVVRIDKYLDRLTTYHIEVKAKNGFGTELLTFDVTTL